MDNVSLESGQKCAKNANTGNAYTGNSLKNARKMENVCLKPGQKCAKNAKVSRLTEQGSKMTNEPKRT